MIFRRLFNLDILARAVVVAHEQRAVISEQRRLIDLKDAEIERLKLDHVRAVRDLVEQFFICQMAGTDVTEDLERGLEDLRDHVARLEEHAPR